MKKEKHLISNIKNNDQPYWPTLKLMLSSLIVFNFYLNLVDKSKYSLLINVFDLTLIPMFVFIVAFITKNTTWKELLSHLLPAFIIYFTFQTIDMLPLYFTGELTLKAFLLSPQYGVWFFLATPIWQAVFLLLPESFKSNKFKLSIILAISLLISYITKSYLMTLSGFFSVFLYFPFFVTAYFINNENISSLRKAPIISIFTITILTVLFLNYRDVFFESIFNTITPHLLADSFFIYIFNFTVSLILGLGIIYFALSTRRYEKISNNALGVYLIHPIICFVILQILNHLGIELNFTLMVISTLVTIILALLLASNSIIHWFIEPVFRSNKLK
ncbi:acetyltransferase [Providencia sp. PROV032]|uniref:acetyltransferase n=1 Tax=Providencia sp. PROV032 TaxID=2949764 RepID=UPI00234B1496|nr:acetyltransferase [Providencia sp. PROV032]